LRVQLLPGALLEAGSAEQKRRLEGNNESGVEGRKMRLAALVSMGLLLLMLAACAEAETIKVPGGAPDLTTALRDARYGDTVLVYPGKYRIQAKLKCGVKLVSAAGPESTTLWNRRWHILRLMDCDMDTEVNGFTFDGVDCNKALACTLGTPSIVNNVIKGPWDGISLQKCNAFIKGNTVEGCNRGISVDMGNPEIVENVIFKNGDGLYLYSSSAIVSRCKIVRNTRGIFIAGYSYPTIGGSLSAANDIISNGFPIYNEGRRIEGTQYTDVREVAIATHNYWGSLCPEKRKFRGEVLISPWVNVDHDSTFTACPEPAPTGGAEKSGETP